MALKNDENFLELKIENLNLANLCIIGIPWDLSSTFRKGVHEAPPVIRKIAKDDLYGDFTEDGVDLARIWRVFDYGDVEVAKSTDEMRKMVYDVIRNMYNDKLRFIFLGGDHFITYFTLHALTQLNKELGVNLLGCTS